MGICALLDDERGSVTSRFGDDMQLDDIREMLQAKIASRIYYPDLPIHAVIAADLMSDVLSFSRGEDTLLLTGLINPQTVRTAEVAAMAAIVFVRGKVPPEDTVRLAEQSGLPLLATSFTMFEACGRLYAAGLRGSEITPAEEQAPGGVPIGSAE